MIASRMSDVCPEDELDQALLDPEGLLSQSLKVEDRHRRKRLFGIAGFALCSCVVLAAVALWPNTVSARDQPSKKTQEATKLWMDRKLEAAELAFLDAIRLNEDDSTAWNGLGWVRNNQGKHDTALEAFRKCLTVNPNHGAAINGIGQSLTGKMEFEEALKWLLKGSEWYFDNVPEDRISPESLPAAAFGFIRVSLLTERYDDAKTWSEKLLKYSPDNEQVKGYLQAAETKDNSSIKSEFELMEKRKKTAELWRHPRGSTEAIDGFRKLLEEDENDIIALNGLGFMLLNSGKHEEAKPLFEKCIELRPTHYGAKNGLARCYKAAGNTDEAIRIWEEICHKIPSVNAATIGLAYTWYEMKDYEKALPFLKQLADSESTSKEKYAATLAEVEAKLKEEK